jgi:hypothetical protein
LEPLFKCRTVRFYSLAIEKEETLKLKAFSGYQNVHDLSRFISSWEDTAFFISKMDLVISIDSGVAHLAGALAVTTWIMLPFASDWRWLSVRQSSPWFGGSPWYPSVRLFRAPSGGGWTSTIESIRKNLLKIINQRSAARSPELKERKPTVHRKGPHTAPNGSSSA